MPDRRIQENSRSADVGIHVNPVEIVLAGQDIDDQLILQSFDVPVDKTEVPLAIVKNHFAFNSAVFDAFVEAGVVHRLGVFVAQH